MRKILLSQLRNASREDLHGHCDAETLTAFAEDRLSSKEREQAAYHLSLCEDCRDVLSLVSRAAGSAPTPAYLPIGIRTTWFTAAAASVCICITVLSLRSGPPPAIRQRTTQPAVSIPARPEQPPPPIKFSPKLTEARISAPLIGGVDLRWRVDSSFHPAILEVSPDKGQTWKRVRVPDFQPKSVAWKEPLVWAVDEQGAVMQSDDNGGHWTRLRHTVHSAPAR